MHPDNQRYYWYVNECQRVTSISILRIRSDLLGVVVDSQEKPVVDASNCSDVPCQVTSDSALGRPASGEFEI